MRPLTLLRLALARLALHVWLFLALVTGCCHPVETVETDPVCSCDCPAGPPAPPQLDTFCVDDAHDGEACCRGSEPPGVCLRRECVAGAAQ